MEILDNILSDIGNFTLVVFGFSATLFTVVYSFILNKREILKEIGEHIKRNKTIDPLLNKKEKNAITFIKTMKSLNVKLIINLFYSLSIYIIAIILKYAPISDDLKKYSIYILAGLTIIILFQIIYLLFVVVRKYIKETKI